MIENKAILNFNDYNWRELFDSNNFFYYHDTDDTFRYDHFNMSTQAPFFRCGVSAPFYFRKEIKSLKRINIVKIY